MDRKVDLVIVGTGAAASTAAYRCRKAGWSVVVVDYRPFGGTCALRGCNPKKVLLGPAELLDWARRMEGRGLVAPQMRIDWPALMRFKRSFTDPVPERVERGFRKAGIDVLHGRARFLDPGTLEVEEGRPAGARHILAARRALIAAGSHPERLGIPGEERVTLSDAFLDLEELPRRIVFIGGGYVSFEFAHIAARAGAEVTILHRGERPLAGFDPDLVARLVVYGRQAGIDVVLNAPVEAVDDGEAGRLAVRANAQGVRRGFEADLVVHGAGRVAELEELELERAGVRYGRGGIEVNGYLQSVSNPAVYAAGDAAASGGLPLTPVAGLEGSVVADNLLAGNERKAEYRGLPTVVFTIPPLASVGLQEKEAREWGLELRVNQGDSSGWFTSRRIGERCSGYKLLIGAKDGEILGAHLLGTHAEEVINLFAMAIRLGLRAGDLKGMLWAYPSASYDISYML